MLGPLGGPELLVVFVFFAIPFVVLGAVANARGQSMAYILWGFLGWIGVIIGLLMMIAMPRRS